jgi:hypothetical protein
MAMLVAVTLATTTLAIAPAPAEADDSGFFIGPEAGVAFRFGSSDTEHAGAAFAGGGTVHDVAFEAAYQVGGHAGYRFASGLAVFLSYDYIAGGVRWKTSYAIGGPDGRFHGDALSHVAMANVAYSPWTGRATALDFTFGAGASVNLLQDVAETYPGAGQSFMVSDGAKVGPAARAGIGIRHALAPWLELGADAAIAYYGGFRTGDARTGFAAGPIAPYGIDWVWGASVGGFVRAVF